MKVKERLTQTSRPLVCHNKWMLARPGLSRLFALMISLLKSASARLRYWAEACTCESVSVRSRSPDSNWSSRIFSAARLRSNE
jgi:hypothetical protein